MIKLSNAILNLIKCGDIQKDDSIYMVDVEKHLCEEFDWENEEYVFPDDTKLQLVKMSGSSEYMDYSEWLITNHIGDIKSDVWSYESFIANDGWVYDVKEEPIPPGEPAKLYIDAMWHHVYDVDFIKNTHHQLNGSGILRIPERYFMTLGGIISPRSDVSQRK